MIARLLRTGVPCVRLEPYQLAREQRELSLTLTLADFPRIRSLAASEVGEIRVRVHFRRDEEGRCRMEGEVGCSLQLHCANCQEIGPLRLAAAVDVCIVPSEAAAEGLDRALDPLIIEGPAATPAELFEDDLLLSMPERPCADQAVCPNSPDLPVELAQEAAASAPTERSNPFAVLAQLKESKDQA